METINNNIEWIDDYDLLKTFHTKNVHIYSDTNASGIYVTLPTVQDFLDNDSLATVLNLFRQPLKKVQHNFEYWGLTTYFQLFNLLFFEFKNIQEFYLIYQHLCNFLAYILQSSKYEIDEQNRTIYINDIVLDESLWNYIWYIIWLSFGEKITKPHIYKDAVERLYMQQMQLSEDRIRDLRTQGKKITTKSSTNQLLEIFTVILYSFKQLTFDFLFNCTNAQINWLSEYAQRIANYELESKIFASGNSKKKKIKFFTEK